MSDFFRERSESLSIVTLCSVWGTGKRWSSHTLALSQSMLSWHWTPDVSTIYSLDRLGDFPNHQVLVSFCLTILPSLYLIPLKFNHKHHEDTKLLPLALCLKISSAEYPSLLLTSSVFCVMVVVLSCCCWVMADSLWPHGLQHARLPCPSPSPGACSKSCPSSQWRHPTISSSVVSFSSCPQSFSASGSFPLSPLFISGNQSIGASAFQHQSFQWLFEIDFL